MLVVGTRGVQEIGERCGEGEGLGAERVVPVDPFFVEVVGLPRGAVVEGHRLVGKLEHGALAWGPRDRTHCWSTVVRCLPLFSSLSILPRFGGSTCTTVDMEVPNLSENAHDDRPSSISSWYQLQTPVSGGTPD